MSTIATAFLNGSPRAKGNHTVTTIGDEVVYLLHGHQIARWNPSAGTFELRHAGYASVTTAKALNALLHVCPWLPFELKAWRLTDVRTGRAVSFPSNGDPIRLARDAKRNPSGLDSYWYFADESTVTSGNSPVIGGK